MAIKGPFISLIVIFALTFDYGSTQSYHGKSLGKLSELHHGVSGEVFAVDSRTLYIKDFTYDGQGPAAYFYASTKRNADSQGFRLRDEKGSGEVIRRYRKEGVTLTLPEGKTLDNIRIFYVWCEEFDVNFGDVKIPRNFDYPRPLKIEALRGVHGVSSDNIVIVDAQTLLIPNLSYDGAAPDAKFWVGSGPKPSPQGIRVPDENGKEVPLRKYNKKTVVLTLPGDLTVFEIGHFGIWCEAFTVDFGHVQIPQQMNVPPSLKMLGVSPQSKLNCEVLQDSSAFEVRWAVAGESIVLQLVAKLDDGEYMSFGLSGDDTKSQMINGDVVVAWIDRETLKGFAEDYFLNDKSQCSGPTGSCPDVRLKEGTNSIRLLNAAMVNGYSIVTYQRHLKASDDLDKPIYANQSQPIIWAIGPLNQRNEVSFHSKYLKGDKFIEFGRPPTWNCPMPETEQPSMKAIPSSKEVIEETTPSRVRNSERRKGSSSRGQADEVNNESQRTTTRARGVSRRGHTRTTEKTTEIPKTVPTPAPVSKRNAWVIPPILCNEPEDGVLYAQMGPTGGKRGYPAITGHVGWGISWYINGLLIPEIQVVRGKTYTFVIEGGSDPEIPAKYHPFYITDDSIGGYAYKTPEERKKVTIFAGAEQSADGTVNPTGTGRLCHWTETGDIEADEFESFGAYQRFLQLKCDTGEPGVIQWTPDKNTPDTVYYQCFTHRYLGWKIRVLDSCDSEPQGSEIKPVRISLPNQGIGASESVRAESMVKPNNLFDAANGDISTFKSTISAFRDSLVEFNDAHQEPTQLPINPHNFYFDPTRYFADPSFFLRNPYYNPYIMPNTFPHPHQQVATFRPSQPILPDTNAIQIISSLPSSSTITTTTSTTTSTTPPSTTLSTKSSTTSARLKDTLVSAASDNSLKDAFIITQLPLSKPINNHKLHLNKHVRRPGIRTNHFIHKLYPYSTKKKPSIHQMSNLLRSPSSIHPIKHLIPIDPSSNMLPLILKSHHLTRPYSHNMYFMPKNKPPKSKTKKPSNIFIITPQVKVVSTKAPHELTTESPQSSKNVEIEEANVIKVEESKLVSSVASNQKPQASQINHPLSSIEIIYPSYNKDQQHIKAKLKYVGVAQSSGFHPENIKIEKGFTPIIKTGIQNRIFEDASYFKSTPPTFLKNIDEEQPPIKTYKKKLYPSYDGFKVRFQFSKDLDYKNLNSNMDTPELDEQNSEDFEDTVAEASRRVDAFYLPPDNQDHKPKSVISQASDIDILAPVDDSEVAPDVVVTYDGKKVSGASLTAKIDSVKQIHIPSLKTSEFIRTVPQYVPFKGELPFEVGAAINNPQSFTHGSINRDLSLPFPPENQGLTKLIPISQNKVRNKRSPHHTPEHTAQQKEESLSRGNLSKASLFYIFNVMVVYLIFKI